MRNFLFILIILSISSCKEQTEKTFVSTDKIEPVVNVNDITSDYQRWYSYYYYNISLSSDFRPLNEKSEVTTKDKFLNKLTSGEYLPIEIKSDSVKIYKLYKIPSSAANGISTTIKNTVQSAYNFYKMEGVKFPNFEFSDIMGKHYNNDSLIGKTTIIKTWFIACKPCVEEMPELNALVENYSDNKNTQFISLALDKKEFLIEFLKKEEFNYKVVDEQKNLIQNKLNLRTYPTHLIIDKTGSIEKVLATASELITYLENKHPIKQKESNLPPPPPPPPPAAPYSKS